jgi:hypothetical protein
MLHERLGVLGISTCCATKPSRHTKVIAHTVTAIDGKNNEDFLSITTGFVY